MSLHAIISKHAGAMRLAGTAVSAINVAACYGESAGVLTIKWAGNGLEPAKSDFPGVSASVWSRAPDTTIMLQPLDAALRDAEVLRAAWALGAWDVARFEHSPLAAGADPHDSRYGITVSFGRSPYLIMGDPLSVGAEGDDALIDRAAKHGRIDWMFRPLALRNNLMRKSWGAKDRTLKSDCTRAGDPPFAPTPLHGPIERTTARQGHQHIYTLGKP